MRNIFIQDKNVYYDTEHFNQNIIFWLNIEFIACQNIMLTKFVGSVSIHYIQWIRQKVEKIILHFKKSMFEIIFRQQYLGL